MIVVRDNGVSNVKIHSQSRVQVDICVQLDFVCQHNIQMRITPSGCKPMFTHRPNYHQARKY